MKVIIAEKPSVAREIARIVRATDRKEGYIEGDEYAVTWAFGHLITLAFPETYGKKGFQRDNLPIVPDSFKLIPKQVKTDKGYRDDRDVVAQLKVIKRLFDSCDEIIVATDAGREGELIFRHIYKYLECAKPFKRLWISSLTDKSIRRGLDDLRCGTEYDNLYYSARARSEADWLIGINATQAVSIAVGRGTYSLGRVQTPTLCMICRRYAENSEFTPQKYWRMTLSVDNGGDIVQLASSKQWFDGEVANEFYSRLKRVDEVTISNIESKEVSQPAPLLYDLTALQKDANRKHGFSADKTLTIAQKLYESKFITYPRTGSSHIPEDMFAEIPKLIISLQQYPQFRDYAKRLKSLTRRCVDDTKITDHHALLITGWKVKELTKSEQTIYDMVAGRMLEAFSDKYVRDTTKITVLCQGEEFTLKGSIIKQSGWRDVWGEEDDRDVVIPAWSEGDTLTAKGYSMSEGSTKPKSLHTESSLLAAMETAGRELEDEDLRESMKECGIGTPATRAAIIETLISRDYIVRSKKSLLPTEKGMALYSVVKPMRVADVEMTGEWEKALSMIADGKMNDATFRKGIEVYAGQITTELLGSRIFFPTAHPQVVCPKCGVGEMQFYAKVVKCGNADCALPIFRQMCEKQLTDDTINELIKSGKTSLIKGFKSKAGKKFDASLAFDEQFKVNFVFAPRLKKR